MQENNPLIKVSMNIILHAGDARLNVNNALQFAQKGEFLKAAEEMNEAERNITLAHQSQTEVIQDEMSGTDYEPCLLFSHAQDTLMTISSEIQTAKHLIELYRLILEKQ
ncbi:MAG: PTS lactose/cellobiose transporter subunit IIA [Erysipelotrichaceae bacterium]|nr:PTS lactose/cellobiose transporter subunit IIA [Erysipelotrichaceae bacterium]